MHLHELSLIAKNNDSLFQLGQLDLGMINIAEPLSRIHRMDVNYVRPFRKACQFVRRRYF